MLHVLYHFCSPCPQLTVEEYVHAMETLVNDYRFTLYNICYKRILCCWIVFAFSVLMGLLFSGLNGIALFSLGVGWLFLNASAIFLCMWLKLRLSRGLERCIAAVNRQLLRHKIIVVLDDRGNISCHKVNLCFMYYEPARCVKYLNDYIARSEQNGVPIEAGWEARLDVEVNDIVIQGSNTTRVSRKQVWVQILTHLDHFHQQTFFTHPKIHLTVAFVSLSLWPICEFQNICLYLILNRLDYLGMCAIHIFTRGVC